MQFVLVHFSTAKEPWNEMAVELYTKKIKHFVDFEVHQIKPSKNNRSQSKEKLKEEAEKLLKFLKPGDEIILFDEKGKSLSSEKFSSFLDQLSMSGKKRIIFVVGGAFGVSDQIKEIAQQKINLSPFVLNHLVAMTVVLEQIYRAFTIKTGLPYHNN